MKTPLTSGHLNRRTALTALAGLPVLAGSILPALAQAPTSSATSLASWNESASKQAITDFVGRVTQKGGSDYVEPAERIAVFDNDGTLWTEHPMYVQLAFALDRGLTRGPNGLPVGIQLVAQQHEDRRLFACARWVWQQFGTPELIG